MSAGKEIFVHIKTADWMAPAIDRIAKMGDELLDLGVPESTVRQAIETAARELVSGSVEVGSIKKRMP